MKYGLTDEQFETLTKLVINPLKANGAIVWIFGSRARGDHRSFSDIDVLFDVKDSNELPKGFLSKLKEAIEESRLPFKVDLVNVNEMAESYKVGALKDRIPL